MMALDKLVDSTQLNTDLTSIANAIRTKGGTSAQLAFPAGFVSAIEAISTGSSDIDWVEYTAVSQAKNVPALLDVVFPNHSDSDTDFWFGKMVQLASGTPTDWNMEAFATVTKNGTAGGGVRWRTNSGTPTKNIYAPTGSTWSVFVNIGDTVKVGRVPK